MKQDLISKWYNPDLTDEQNVSLLKEHGISISVITLKRWRKKQGISKEKGGDRKSQHYKDNTTKIKVSLQNQSIKDNKEEKSKYQNQSIISDQSEKIKVSNPINQSITSKSKYQNQDAILENQSIKSEEIKVSKSENQSAISEEDEILDWDLESGEFLDLGGKNGEMTSEEFDRLFGDDSVPHYTGKMPPKEITIDSFRNDTGEPPVNDVYYYLQKNLPKIIDEAEEFKKWINATFYLLKGTKNWTDYKMHRETYSKILAAANRAYNTEYEKGTTVEQWQIERAKDSYYKMWGNKYIYFQKKYSNEPYNIACEDLYRDYGIVPMRLEDYKEMMDIKLGRQKKQINSDPNWQPFSMKGNTYNDESYEEDDEEEISYKNKYDNDISNKAVNGMSNEEMLRFVCDGNF